MTPQPRPSIMHIRLDSFLASIEEARHPEWSGRPIVVASRAQPHEPIVSLNARARRLGFRPGQTVAEVTQRCPIVMSQPVDLIEAEQRSKDFFALLCRFSENVEPRLLDEAFIELSDNGFSRSAPVDFAASIQRAITAELGLTASIGIARTKTAAWAASQDKRPNGLTVVRTGDERTYLYPLLLNRLYTLGERTRNFLIAHGITTIGQLGNTPVDWLIANFGAVGREISAQARGLDQAPVESIRPTRTISRSLRFDRPIYDRAWITTAASYLVEKAKHAADDQERTPGSMTLRLTTNLGRSHQRQLPIAGPLSLDELKTRLLAALTAQLQTYPEIRSIEVELGRFKFQNRALARTVWGRKEIRSALLGLQWRMNGVGSQLFSKASPAGHTALASV